MKSVALLILLAALVCGAFARHHSHTPIHIDDRDESEYDFLSLAQSWPGSTCRMKTCNYKTKPLPKFLVHGLWPDRSDGTYPSFCNRTDTIDYSQISGELQADMNTYWPSLFGQGSESFWSYEWNKHGTCAHYHTYKTQHDYFQSAIDIRKSLDIEDLLAQQGVSPREEPYEVSDLYTALNAALGEKYASINCYSGYLTEIWTCISKDTLKPMRCPDEYYHKVENRCSGTIKYSPFN
eukprot:GFYU01000781.1.p1 GENE.GFYU01000781.1~~GFYU01000781.1.p1  ORF type:complete len:237 (+),score=66.77 GFYU01000781.1:76-786(+)